MLQASIRMANGTIVSNPKVASLRIQVQAQSVEPAESIDHFPVYSEPQKACNADATQAVTFWQRGRYVITAQALFPASSQATADRWLRDLVGISYESIFSDVLRPEMR